MHFNNRIDRTDYMPASTLFHPVSIYVIRGSLIHCGFTPGRLSQLGCNQTLGTARYRIAITKVPKQERDASPARMKKLINDCFVDDIECTEVWHKSDGSITAYISVDVHRGEPNQLTIPESSYSLENSIESGVKNEQSE